jgi:hypothetical protein
MVVLPILGIRSWNLFTVLRVNLATRSANIMVASWFIQRPSLARAILASELEGRASAAMQAIGYTVAQAAVETNRQPL